MEASKNKRDFLERILTEYGYSGWYVIEPNRQTPGYCFLFNPREKKMGEISIPLGWLDNPPQRGTIGELLASTIQNSTYVLPKAHRSFP
jgi:hypothetical protein